MPRPLFVPSPLTLRAPLAQAAVRPPGPPPTPPSLGAGAAAPPKQLPASTRAARSVQDPVVSPNSMSVVSGCARVSVHHGRVVAAP
eukprot:5263333-Alexandrium_andersonii.AAC.1